MDTAHFRFGEVYRGGQESAATTTAAKGAGRGVHTPGVFSRTLMLVTQKKYDMRHKMLTQRALFVLAQWQKKGMLSQHFMTHVVPPLLMTTGT